MTKTEIAVAAFLLVAILVASSVPVTDAYNCVPDCIQRCSNGKNLEACESMCKTACLPSTVAEVAAKTMGA